LDIIPDIAILPIVNASCVIMNRTLTTGWLIPIYAFTFL